MLDADIAIYALGGNERVLATIAEHMREGVALSAIVHSQLLQGARDAPVRALAVAKLTATTPILPYDEAASSAYGRVAAALPFVRALVLDRMIAAHAISVGATLVTNNVTDFDGVPGLSVENWAA